MPFPNDDELGPDLQEIAHRLRTERAQASPLELDRLKLRAQAQAAGGRRTAPLKGRKMRSHATVLALAAVLIGGTTAGGIALQSSSDESSNPSAAASQYSARSLAPGFYCNQAGASKKRVPGQRGTQFSECVRRVNRARANPNMEAARACRGLSRKRKPGSRRSSYGKCIVAVQRQRRDERS